MNQLLLIITSLLILGCSEPQGEILTGADQMEKYLPLLTGRNIAIVANHTSVIEGTHLVDTLYSLSKGQFEIQIIQKVFAPEHGFRGDFDAGATVENETDSATGIPIVSLYGRHKKPTAEDLDNVDLVLFDIQDVGVRFYTYISTLHYVMEACAENKVPLLILDRPNPNGGFVDGPVLEAEYASFVGMHPIPVVYGLTIGELAMMINGEGWLEGGIQCELSVIPCAGYSHSSSYSLPVKPSPNLPNDHAVKLYPSTCFFEGTVISEGRGTMMPFEVFGHPELQGEFSFTPVSIPGMSKYPKFEGELCFGEDLRGYEPKEGWAEINLEWLIGSFNSFPDKENFFIPYFDKLAGTSSLRIQIRRGLSEEEIRDTWQEEIDRFHIIRKKYLLYN